MARLWLNLSVILASLAAGAACSTALADNKFSGGSFRSSGGGSPGSSVSRGSMSRSSVVPRVSGNVGGSGSGGFRPPATRVGGNFGNNVGNIGGQVFNKGTGNVLNKPPVVTGPKPPVVGPKFPTGPKPPIGGSNGGNNGGIKINPIPIVGGAGGGLKANPLGPFVDKVGGLKLNPIVAGKVGGITIGPPKPVVDPAGPVGPKGILPGGCYPSGNVNCTPCNPFKPGCHPWWFCPAWVSPAHCQTIVYTEPIIVPVSVPAAPIVVTVPVETAPAAPAVDQQPAATDAAQPATAAPEDKLLQVPLGATLTLQAKELGEQAGQVIVQIEKIAMPALVSDWQVDSVTATLPTVAIAENLRAELLLVKADGQVASSVKVELTPAGLPVAEDAKLAGDPATALPPAALNP